MNIGPLNSRCRIEYRSTTQDPIYKTDVVTWTPIPIAPVRWCNLQDVLPSRSEAVSHDIEVSRSTTRLRLRYCTDLDSTMRIIVNRPQPVIYQIISGPAIIGDKDGVEFMIERVSTE
jgi:head-tail adaptor